MHLFSLRALWSGVWSTVRRFPTEVVIVLLATAISIILVHGTGLALSDEIERQLTLSVIACIFLFAAQLSITLAFEVGGIATAVMWTLRATATALALVVMRVLDLDSDATPIELISLYVGIHACIALAPWRRGALATWDIGRTLLVRMGVAGIFTAVLTGGLALAVTSLNVLFDLPIEDEVYGTISVLCIGLFNTMVVLAGVPRATDEPQSDLPVALRWFVQFVLIPLVLIFLVILYAYGVRVVFFNDLRGAVAGYVLALNVFALLALVLAWPLREHPEHRVVGVFVRWIGPVMVPMTVLLALAIGIRIADYGITPERFGVALLTAFVTIVNVYLLRRSNIDVRAIPLVLTVLGLTTALGPLGSTQSTVRSQSRRLTNALRDAYAIGPRGIDTIAFQRANDTIRSTFFGAFETIRSVDSAAARTLLTEIGIPFTSDSGSGRPVITSMGVPITSVTVDAEQTYLTITSTDNDDQTIAMPQGIASAFTVGHVPRSGRTGHWKFAYRDDLQAVILNKIDTSAADTLSLRHMFVQARASNEAPIGPYLITSASGKRVFVVQSGWMQFERDVSPEFSLDGLFIDTQRQ